MPNRPYRLKNIKPKGSNSQEEVPVRGIIKVYHRDYYRLEAIFNPTFTKDGLIKQYDYQTLATLGLLP